MPQRAYTDTTQSQRNNSDTIIVNLSHRRRLFNLPSMMCSYQPFRRNNPYHKTLMWIISTERRTNLTTCAMQLPATPELKARPRLSREAHKESITLFLYHTSRSLSTDSTKLLVFCAEWAQFMIISWSDIRKLPQLCFRSTPFPRPRTGVNTHRSAQDSHAPPLLTPP